MNDDEKYHKPLMGTAHVWAQMSYCKRRKVGAILAKGGRVLNTGYNGTISGQPNNCEEPCESCRGTGKIQEEICPRCQGKGELTNNKVVHAEKNLIAFCAKRGIPTEDCTVYVTLSPCLECASLLTQAGIKKVIYDEEYRDRAGLDFLIELGVEVEQFKH